MDGSVHLQPHKVTLCRAETGKPFRSAERMQKRGDRARRCLHDHRGCKALTMDPSLPAAGEGFGNVGSSWAKELLG